jgi:FAD:protein FMN transferase
VDENAKVLIRVSRRAMASEFEVCFPVRRCPHGTDLAIEALDRVEWLEGQLSYFLPTSEISRINRLAAAAEQEVEPWLWDLLCLALRVGEETGGAYDITSAPLWELWGFARRAGAIPSDAELAAARSCVGGHLVQLDSDKKTIRFLKPGVRINLGSIGKGYALDACAERLAALGMTDFLLHGGQSSVLARGEPDGMEGDGTAQGGTSLGPTPKGNSPIFADAKIGTVPTPPWEVGLRHPGRSGRRFGVVRLRDRALGTSGGQFQSFRHRGRRYGHILDPRSGRPAEGVLSATVVASTAALADALSTAFYVLGPRESSEYCRTHPEVGMVMLCSGQRGGGVDVHTAGLGSDTWVVH